MTQDVLWRRDCERFERKRRDKVTSFIIRLGLALVLVVVLGLAQWARRIGVKSHESTNPKSKWTGGAEARN